MNNSYKIAPVKDNKEVIGQISKYEEELAKKLGHEVVLILYEK